MVKLDVDEFITKIFESSGKSNQIQNSKFDYETSYKSLRDVNIQHMHIIDSKAFFNGFKNFYLI